MFLVLTQAITDMSTRNNSLEVKPAGAYDWHAYHLDVPNVSKSESLNLLEPSEPVTGLHRDCFTFIHIQNFINQKSWSYLADRRFQKHTAVPVAVCTDQVSRGSRDTFRGNKQGTGNLQELPSLPEGQTRVLCWRGPGCNSGPGRKNRIFLWTSRYCKK